MLFLVFEKEAFKQTDVFTILSNFTIMIVFKRFVSKRNKMIFFIILLLGVLLTVLGLYIGLKQLDPKYFNAMIGSIITIYTLFGVFGNLSKEISIHQFFIFHTRI